MQDFSLARRMMVDSQLRPEAVTSRAVLAAMGSVPREDHVPAEARPFAYFDRSIPLPGGGAMMPPAALGKLLDALDPKMGERALVVGSAPGYPAALLRHMRLDVDEIHDVDEFAVKRQYDVLLFDGAIEFDPEQTLAQVFLKALAAGGRIGAALMDRGVARLAVGTRVGGGVAWRTIADAGVTPLAGFEPKSSFSF